MKIQSPMNILVIGNGFDLAHGLPTKYTDFLDFIDVIEQVTNVKNENDLSNIDWKDINSKIKDKIKEKMGNVRNNLHTQKEMWKNLLEDNFWIFYFNQCQVYKNWIDFEGEISKVIQSLDNDMKEAEVEIESGATQVSNTNVEKFFHKRLSGVLLDADFDMTSVTLISYREIRDVLYNDLNRLIKAFEIYISEYIEEIDAEKTSDEIGKLNIDHVLSFNYSHTYEKFYDKLRKAKYDYIHGEANKDSETNNMVLGIDEYLQKKRRDKEIDFIDFKKYYQRIFKSTGSEYKNWLYDIQESGYENKKSLCEQFPKQIPYEKFNIRHKLYIFGHSLDVTDKDILRELILNDNIYTTIYYCRLRNEKGELDNGERDLNSKIANLVKVIGQEELIRRTGGSTKTIEFKLQDL